MGLLWRISQLRRDLSAVVIVEEEKGHFQYPNLGSGHGMETWDYAGGDSWVDWDSIDRYNEAHKKWVVDKPAVTEPDLKKRQEARAALEYIRDNSVWYNVSWHLARRALRGAA
jgi:hypothetical protein